MLSLLFAMAPCTTLLPGCCSQQPLLSCLPSKSTNVILKATSPANSPLVRVHEDIGVDEGGAESGQWSAMTMKKAVCSVLSSAAVMWSLPGWVPNMAMAEAATTPYAESQSDRLQIGLLNG
jgi:hypothetical protein